MSDKKFFMNDETLTNLSQLNINGKTFNLKDAKAQADITAEVTRATAAESTLSTTIEGEITRAKAAEGTLSTAIEGEITRAKGVESELSTAITSESSRATGVESGLDKRISNLEARGRYLSTWDASTGTPGDYPEIPEGATSPYTYTYKAGDYYILNNVATGEGAVNYMPKGGSISATYDEGTKKWTWTIDKEEYKGTDALVIGGQFLYSSSSWTYVATAKDVAWGNITGNISSQTDLKAALDAKASTTTVSGIDTRVTALETTTASHTSEIASIKTDYVPNTRTIAGIDLADNITVAELEAATALNLKALSHKDTATGTTTLDTIDSITMNPLTVAGSASITYTVASATVSKGDYTPEGDITGDAIKGGSIAVSITHTVTEASLTKDDYTPEGSVTAVDTVNAVTSVSITKNASGAFQLEGTLSAPTLNINLATTSVQFVNSVGTLPTFDVSQYVGATFTFNGGSTATWTGATYTAPTLGNASTSSFIKKGYKIEATTSSEVLSITALTASDTEFFGDAVTAQGTFDAGTVNFGTFNGGSVASVTNFSGGSIPSTAFDAGTLPTLKDAETMVSGLTSATAVAPIFTGEKYSINAPTEAAMKTATFTGTLASDIIVTKVEYDKASINSATFTPVTTTLGFSGKTAKIDVTKVEYDKASGNGSFSVEVTPTVATYTRTGKNISITVS